MLNQLVAFITSTRNVGWRIGRHMGLSVPAALMRQFSLGCLVKETEAHVVITLRVLFLFLLLLGLLLSRSGGRWSCSSRDGSELRWILNK